MRDNLLTLLFAMSLSVGYAQLSGSYTINPSGSGSTNYTSFSAAAQALSNVGVSGPVTFYIAEGIYVEHVLFDSIAGTSGTNRILFRPDSIGEDTVVIKHSVSAQYQYTLRIDGADWIEFQHVQIKTQSGNTGSAAGARVTGHSKHVSFKNCLFTEVPSSAYEYGIIHLSVYAQADHLQVIDCDFIRSKYPIMISEYNSSYLDSVLIQGCTFHKFTRDGMNLSRLLHAQIIGNTVVRDTTGPTGVHGMIIYFSPFIQVKQNHVYSTAVGFEFALNLYDCDGTDSNRSVISNNCLSGGLDGINAGGGVGLAIAWSNYADIFHNTMSALYEDNGSYAANIYCHDGVRFVNNICYNPGGGHAIQMSWKTQFDLCDYNVYYTTGPHIIHEIENPQYYTLAGWVTYSDHGDHSLNMNPLFNDPRDCQSCQGDIDKEGLFLANVPDDLFGHTRNSLGPSIGAIEYLSAGNFQIGPDSTYCSDQLMLIGNAADTTIWTVNGDSISSPNLLLEINNCQPQSWDVSVYAPSSFCGTATDSAHIELRPGNNLADSLHICADTFEVVQACADSGSSFTWSSGSTNSFDTLDFFGWHYVTKASGTCVFYDSIWVNQSEGVSIDDIDACQIILPFSVDATISQGMTYQWDGGLYPTSPVNELVDSGMYFVSVTDSLGCGSSDSFYFTVLLNPEPIISWDSAAGLVFFSSANSLHTYSNPSYQWSFGAGSMPSSSYQSSDTVQYSWMPLDSNESMNIMVSLTITTVCSSTTETQSVTFMGPTGIESSYPTELIQFFPNPSDGIVQVTAQSNIQTLRVTNLMGQIVHESRPMTPFAQLDLSNLNGPIHIEVVTDRQSIVGRVVISGQ